MSCRFATTTVVLMLIAAVALFCLGDLVEAAAPSAEHASCASRLCDQQTGCSTAPVKPATLPIAALAAPIVLAPAAAASGLAPVVSSPVPRDRQVAPLGSRSPPLV